MVARHPHVNNFGNLAIAAAQAQRQAFTIHRLGVSCGCRTQGIRPSSVLGARDPPVAGAAVCNGTCWDYIS